MYCSDEAAVPAGRAAAARARTTGATCAWRWPCWTAWASTWSASGTTLAAAVASFEGLPHRLTEIEDPSGLTFVDDTLSTSPYSAMHAIDAYEGRPLTVLVGGTDRGPGLRAAAASTCADRELTVIGMPDSGPRILAELAGLPAVRTEPAEDLPAAVRLARKLTPAGGVVLLSPAAPELRAVPQLRAPLRGLRPGDPRQRLTGSGRNYCRSDPSLSKRPRV